VRTVTYVGKAHRLDFEGTILMRYEPTEVSNELASKLSTRDDVLVDEESPDEGEEEVDE
jgi:hypothetical protein